MGGHFGDDVVPAFPMVDIAFDALPSSIEKSLQRLPQVAGLPIPICDGINKGPRHLAKSMGVLASRFDNLKVTIAIAGYPLFVKEGFTLGGPDEGEGLRHAQLLRSRDHCLLWILFSE